MICGWPGLTKLHWLLVLHKEYMWCNFQEKLYMVGSCALDDLDVTDMLNQHWTIIEVDDAAYRRLLNLAYNKGSMDNWLHGRVKNGGDDADMN